MRKLTDLEKLKCWADAEFTLLHILFAVVMLELTTGWIWNIILGVFIAWDVLYVLARLATIAADDPNYLKLPKK